MTIQERAADYVGKSWSNIEDFNEDHVTFENIVTDSFVAGAQSERKELLRWRDPEVELPDSSKFDWVLLRVQYADGFIGIPKIGELRSDGLWHCTEYDDLKLGESFEAIYGCKVIGWRPLEEELLATE